MTYTSDRRSVCPVLIGRDDAVGALHRHVEAVAGGDDRAALIAGDAGIGKSALLAAVKLDAVSRGFVTLEGACFPQDRTEPFAPLADILHARFAGCSQEAITGALEPFVRDLQPLLPDLLPPVSE